MVFRFFNDFKNAFDEKVTDTYQCCKNQSTKMPVSSGTGNSSFFYSNLFRKQHLVDYMNNTIAAFDVGSNNFAFIDFYTR
jgi:hypothetical protein